MPIYYRPVNEVKRKIRFGYRKKFQETDSPKDIMRIERKRESNRKASEKSRIKKRKIQSIKDKVILYIRIYLYYFYINYKNNNYIKLYKFILIVKYYIVMIIAAIP